MQTMLVLMNIYTQHKNTKIGDFRNSIAWKFWVVVITQGSKGIR